MKNLLKHFIFCWIAAIVLISCDETKSELVNESWLNNYAGIKCAWANTEAAFAKDTVQSTAKLYQQLAEARAQKDEMSSPIRMQIGALEEKIKETRQKYFDEYHRMRDEHIKLHGHLSTPEYDKRVDANEKKRDREVAALQAQIDSLKNSIENSSENRQMRAILAEIEKSRSILKEKYRPTFDSLQTELDKFNHSFKTVIRDLKEPEKQIFIKKRDSLTANPCKDRK